MNIIGIVSSYNSIAPAAACRIISAPEEVTRLSPLMSAAASVAGSHEAEPRAAIASAIAASAEVMWSSRLRSPVTGRAVA